MQLIRGPCDVIGAVDLDIPGCKQTGCGWVIAVIKLTSPAPLEGWALSESLGIRYQQPGVPTPTPRHQLHTLEIEAAQPFYMLCIRELQAPLPPVNSVTSQGWEQHSLPHKTLSTEKTLQAPLILETSGGTGTPKARRAKEDLQQSHQTKGRCLRVLIRPCQMGLQQYFGPLSKVCLLKICHHCTTGSYPHHNLLC